VRAARRIDGAPGAGGVRGRPRGVFLRHAQLRPITSADNKTEAADMLRFFTRYLLEHAPQFEDGHTFSVSEGKPVYRVERTAAIDYGEGSLFNNPYGAWRLTPVAPEKKGNWWVRNRQ
jgi:hypothetical protein